MNNDIESELVKETVRAIRRRAFRNGLIITSILMVIGAFVLEFIPEGWWVLAINIVGILLTAWILLSTAIPTLKVYLPTLIAVTASSALWFVMFVAIRFVIGAILGMAVLSPMTGLDKGTERQEVVDYLKTMMPVMEAHADWNEDQNAFAQTRHPDYNQAMTGLGDLVRRMEKIYMDVETSMPPKELRGFKRKWSRVCQLDLQALALTIQAWETGDVSLLREINDLTFEANAIDDEVGQELLDIIDQYDIQMEDLY